LASFDQGVVRRWWRPAEIEIITGTNFQYAQGKKMINWLRALIALGCLGFGITIAQAQNYPSKAIIIVAPSAPGGITDTLARLLAQRFGEASGQPAIVENKAGANNQIGAEFVARSAPDGYTLFLSPEATFVVNPSLYAKLAYDPVKDFAPISGLVSIQHSLIVNPALPVRNVGDLIQLAKQKPGQLTYGTFGVGSSGHINMEMFQTMAGVKLLPVHYKGATPALTDVIAGHIQMMFLSVGSAMPSVRAGKVKMIAIASKSRMPQLPDVPTIAESGLTDFEAVSWFGLFAPGGTPPEIVNKINAEVKRIFSEPDFRRKFLEPQFMEPMTSSPEEFAEYIRTDVQKWSLVLRAANVKIE
jgi:tripartite-type tricarboxylate transporter receptor subunit TctC